MFFDLILGFDLLLFSLVVLIFTTLLFAIYAAKNLWQRSLLTVLSIVAIPSVLLAIVVSLGQPRPYNFNLINEDSLLIAYHFIYDEKIFLWLLPTNNIETREPFYVSLPWSTEMAQELKDASEEAEGDDNVAGVIVNLPTNSFLYEHSLEEGFTFHMLPVPARAPKEEISQDIIRTYDELLGGQ